MFEFLKKKISDFTEKIKEKISGKESAVNELAAEPVFKPEEKKEKIEELKPFASTQSFPEEAAENEKAEEKAPAIAKAAEPKKANGQSSKARKPEPIKQDIEKRKPEDKVDAAEGSPKKQEILSKDLGEQQESTEAYRIPEIKGKAEDKRELKAKISLATKLKGFVKKTITITEEDLESLLFELELSLLESDVEQSAALEIISNIRKELSGKEIEKGKDISEVLKEEIRKSLLKVMASENIDIFAESAKKKPYVILFLGPNGAGKTTTIAKLTSMFQKKGKKAVWAASDTFRAASFEQLEEHAKNLNVKVVKHKYGSDPAAVAFDAIESAKAHGIDVVMIDSAGRQETNKNLMEELKKIVRVAKPDLKVYVGESYAGQSLLNQALEFDKALGIDGFILTKVDADAKGGTAISLLYSLKKPILFIGTGQEYDKLVPFRPEFIVDRIV